MTNIVSSEDVMGGQPRIEGHRISVLQVAEWVLEEGMAPETVSSEFDLDLADVYHALGYYYDHIEGMDEWRERRRERIAETGREQPPPDSFTETV